MKSQKNSADELIIYQRDDKAFVEVNKGYLLCIGEISDIEGKTAEVIMQLVCKAWEEATRRGHEN